MRSYTCEQHVFEAYYTVVVVVFVVVDLPSLSSDGGGVAPTEYNIRFRCPILFISRTACNSISQMRLIRSISVYKCFLKFSNERERKRNEIYIEEFK